MKILIQPQPEKFFTEYSRDKVERLLNNFMFTRGLTSNYSAKRCKDERCYIIGCPGVQEHSHNNRHDDCVIYFTPKPNGFVWISCKCRHNSCWSYIEEYVKDLNNDWGVYLNANY